MLHRNRHPLEWRGLDFPGLDGLRPAALEGLLALGILSQFINH